MAELRDGYCSYPHPTTNPCSSTITKAHTIQKKGGLAAIAEAGHVLTVKPTLKEMIASDGKPSPHKIGVNNASVFPGFCSRHDDGLFKAIEGKVLSLTKDAAFLFAYRAIAYERFAKEAQLRAASIQRSMDCGQPFAIQAYVQRHLAVYIHGVQIGIRDIGRWKSQFDERLLSGARDDFHFLAVRFDRVLPIVACSAFHPEFDLQGNPLQRLGRESIELEHITLTVTTFENQTIMVFGWIGSADGSARALAKSFQSVADARKADALIRLLFVQTDNLFVRPSWWEGLHLADRQTLTMMTRSGTTLQRRLGRELADDSKIFVTAAVAETVSL